jgi:hypothetical protein
MESRISERHERAQIEIYISITKCYFTYDHRTLKTRLPVRSALFKQRTGGLVVRWVTTSEYPLLYVFVVILHLQRTSCVFYKAHTRFLVPHVLGSGNCNRIISRIDMPNSDCERLHLRFHTSKSWTSNTLNTTPHRRILQSSTITM